MRRGNYRPLTIIERTISHRAQHHGTVEAGARRHRLHPVRCKALKRVRGHALIELAVRIIADEAVAPLRRRCPVRVFDVATTAEELELTVATLRLLLHRGSAQLATHAAVLPDLGEGSLQHAAAPK